MKKKNIYILIEMIRRELHGNLLLALFSLKETLTYIFLILLHLNTYLEKI